MEKSAELLERVAASEPIERKLDAIQLAKWPVLFSHVIQPAQAFLAALIANARHGRRLDKRQAADSTIWVLCPSVHSQEVCYESLLNWQSDALFLPEAELTGIENVLPDPEIAAERLALFLQIERDTAARIIVPKPTADRARISANVGSTARGAVRAGDEAWDFEGTAARCGLARMRGPRRLPRVQTHPGFWQRCVARPCQGCHRAA